MDQPFREKERKGFFAFLEDRWERVVNRPNDVDVLVMTREPVTIPSTILPLNVVEPQSGYGGIVWRASIRSDFLHLFFMTEAQFRQSHANGESEALSVASGSGLLCGELPEFCEILPYKRQAAEFWFSAKELK
jgi:hypothetical protein